MRRKLKPIISVTFVMILLVAGVSNAEISTGQVSFPFCNDYPEARKFADSYQEKYGVVILLGEECMGVSEDASFSVREYAPAKSPFLGMMGYRAYTEQLEKLERALSQYPKGFLENLRDENAPKGLRILIANQIIDTEPGKHSNGYANCEDSYYNIFLAHTFFTETTVHHELWHVMESMITTRYPGAFLIWDSLNPEGFRYSNDYTCCKGEYDADFFARDYGTINAGEDRATIAEAVFYENRNEWFSERPAVKRKLDAMNLAMRDVLNIQYNVKVTENGQTALQ